MRRLHTMPFGAEALPEGGVRFRLWAPSAAAVELVLGAGEPESTHAMEPVGDGWLERVVAEAGPGTRYGYRLPDGLRVPDPASRYQPEDVHAPSEVVDPAAYVWADVDWQGRPWEEAVLYELHVGSFSERGDFRGVVEQLDRLAGLGVTAVELMPVSDFPGRRGWGYDGVLPFAPESAYGRPEDLKALVDAAHARGLMVFLDVVYNHFGPDGNYLHAYAEQFFTERHHTPWGAGINFDGPHSDPVRAFFIHNALYWLDEYHIDGLRLDAVHAIADDSSPDILEALAEAVWAGPGRERRVHLVLENDDNAAHYLRRGAEGGAHGYTAQWNDDIHHAFHVLLTGEGDGYYADYAGQPARHLGRCLAEGFAYQGEPSPYRDGARRGEPSAGLPPTAFVAFLQNHDQVGNRAFGERLTTLAEPAGLEAALAVLLLAPAIPLLFMGDELGVEDPFQYFCDFQGELAAAVTEGRRREFAGFARFAEPHTREAIPDPCDPGTFARSRPDWSAASPPRARRLALVRTLLELRHEQLVPRLAGSAPGAGFDLLGERGLRVRWRLGDGASLTLLANLGPAPTPLAAGNVPTGTPLFALPAAPDPTARHLEPWSAAWYLVAP